MKNFHAAYTLIIIRPRELEAEVLITLLGEARSLVLARKP